MDFKTIIYDTREGVAKITINRPERMNGYNEHMVKEMVAAIDLARQDDDIRVLIITGTGRAFCAGGRKRYWQICNSSVAASVTTATFCCEPNSCCCNVPPWAAKRP